MSTVPSDWEFLNAHNDIHRRALTIGTRVRTFDFPNVVADQFWGLDLDGERACYAEGTIEAIGEDIVEGCPRYRIRIDRVVFRGESTQPASTTHLYPPLNGTPSLNDYPTFGVTAL